MKKKLQTKIKTAISLGINNILKVFIYRLQLKTGYFNKLFPQKVFNICNIFEPIKNKQSPIISKDSIQKIIQKSNAISKGNLTFFSHAKMDVGTPPNWFLDPFSKKLFKNSYLHWASFVISNDNTGDIKIIWEMSRMDWALTISKSYILSGNINELNLINFFIKDWMEKNPPNAGPNWMCAQETSIRLIHIILCGHILKQDKPLKLFIDFVICHCQRISVSMHYAKAQMNNHATSEAAGLLIGGMWLNYYSNDIKVKRLGDKWQKKGRNQLEKAIKKLVGQDGSFSQHSLNYHRVLISTLNMSEYFRMIFQQENFSKNFYKKATLALLWLYNFTDPISGKGPNLGANDGAYLYSLTETSYEDYRPDIQLGACLFLKKKLYQDGPWNEFFQWLQIDPDKYPYKHVNRKSQVMTDGGYVIFSNTLPNNISSWAMVRSPNKRFRPHHADSLHFDFWFQGSNILRDSGSYSYGENEPLRPYFASSSAHNTISFDSHDQMPAISRFLYGQWIKTEVIKPFKEESGTQTWCGAYIDHFGCRHQREISTDGVRFIIIDKVEGFKNIAVLRWRLINRPWKLKDNCLEGEQVHIKISANVQFNISLVEGLESLYYMQKRTIPVLEIYFTKNPATIQTEIIILNKNTIK